MNLDVNKDAFNRDVVSNAFNVNKNLGEDIFQDKPIRKKYIVLFNGPPNSGKDTLASGVSNLLDSVGYIPRIINFKDELVNIVKNMYLLSDADMAYVSSREKKELPTQILGNKSYRETLIHVSENIIKPNLGNEYFVNSVINKIRLDNTSDVIFIPDLGFTIELDHILSRFNTSHEIIVYRLHRPNTSFENDCRKYIEDDLCRSCQDLTVSDEEGNLDKNLDIIYYQLFSKF